MTIRKEYWLTQEERRELKRILDYHERCENVGVEFSNNNGIGVATRVRCLDCKQEWNITDYSVW